MSSRTSSMNMIAIVRKLGDKAESILCDFLVDRKKSPLVVTARALFERMSQRQSAPSTPQQYESFLKVQQSLYLSFLSVNLGVAKRELKGYVREFQKDIRKPLEERINALQKEVGGNYAVSWLNQEVLYALVRAKRPDIVVETGVMFGASSAVILEAMRKNGRGKLQSIDMPYPELANKQGCLVDDRLRQRWELHTGDAKILLPSLVKRLDKKIDIFMHDSRHSFGHMMWEFLTVKDHLSEKGIVVSHDVQYRLPFRKPFQLFAQRESLPFHVIQDLGVAVKTA